MTIIGYGDVVPVTRIERISAAAIGIVNGCLACGHPGIRL
jgi:hypothetical protein